MIAAEGVSLQPNIEGPFESGICDHVLRRSIGDHAPGIEQHDTIAEAGREIEVMHDDDDSGGLGQ